MNEKERKWRPNVLHRSTAAAVIPLAQDHTTLKSTWTYCIGTDSRRSVEFSF